MYDKYLTLTANVELVTLAQTAASRKRSRALVSFGQREASLVGLPRDQRPRIYDSGTRVAQR